MVIAADNDDAATEQAEKMLDGVRVESLSGLNSNNPRYRKTPATI
jgi:hypothetical protein